MYITISPDIRKEANKKQTGVQIDREDKTGADIQIKDMTIL